MESQPQTSCSVCHEGIEVFAVGCCDHIICYKCSCRMRVLCEQYYCPICRTDLPQVYLVKEDMKFSDIPRHGYIPNRKNKIFFQSDKIKGLFDTLLENRCKLCTHARPERTFKDLQNHVRKQHTLFYCDLCIDHLKLFPSERKCYNRHDLAVHRRQGDKDDSSYKGHPLCLFCDERYMDKDELYRHLRKEHFFCHFCDPEGCSEFYNDYKSLRDHFREKHYLCQEGACLGTEIRLTHAFRSKIDLQAHIAAEHGTNFTKAQAKQMRTIDIDYQLPPRDRRRDRGVVNAADYEDKGPIQSQTFHNSQGSRGHAGRPRYEDNRGFRKGNFSEEDVQRAINASLDVMKEVEKKPELKEEVEEVKKVVRDSENFPVLGHVKSDHLRTDSPVDSDNKDSDSEALDFSMAKQIALKNKRSVQHGRLISEEFPTLMSDTPVEKPSEPVVTKPLKPQKPHPSVSSKPVSKLSNVKNKGPIHSEDFPGLPTKSSSSKSAIGSASWGSKQGKDTKSKPVAINVTMNTPNNNNQKPTSGKGPKKTSKVFNDDFPSLEGPGKGPKKTSKVFNDDFPSLEGPGKGPKKTSKVFNDDFPSLEGPGTAASAANINWLKKSAVTSKSKMEKKQIDWFDRDDDFSMENVITQSKTLQTDDKKTSENKKKKKKKDKHKDSSSENPSQTTAGSSLDSIASTLLSSNPKSYTKDFDHVKKENDGGIKERKSDGRSNSTKEERTVNSPKNEERKRPASPKDIYQEKIDNAINSLAAIDENKFSVLSEDIDTPVLTVETKPFKLSKKEQVKIKLDDFPTLGAANPSKAPPPGFAKPQQPPTKKPPGFSEDLSMSKRPPPGFSTTSKQNGHETEKKPPSFTLKNIMPMMTEMSNFDYVAPENSKERNQKLIQKIRESCLGENQDSFDQFKLVSAGFRQGTTCASDYYSQCQKLIGKDNFQSIFPELLVLLPDIDKQQELLTTFKTEQDKYGNVIRISGKSANAPWKQTTNFYSCPTCRQVLLSSETNNHISIHNTTSDFPSLGGETTGMALRAFVKTK